MILGGDSPRWALEHAETWGQFAGVVRWDWGSIEAELGDHWRAFCRVVGSPQLRANYARHWILAIHGGAYADWDTEPQADPFRLDEWGDRFAIASHVGIVPWLDNCFMYSPCPQHPVARRILEEVDFTRLAAEQITRRVGRDPMLFQLPREWNRYPGTAGAIIEHHHLSGSLSRPEMDWLRPRMEGRRVLEVGCGLRSIELAEWCDLTSVESKRGFADRARRSGVDVRLETSREGYVRLAAELSRDAEAILVDGRLRMECLEAMRPREGVQVYLHDSKRRRYVHPDRWQVAGEMPGSRRGLAVLTRLNN